VTSHESFLTTVYNRVTQDAVLQELSGGEVRLFHKMATPDPPFPYHVYKLRFELVDEIIADGQLLWDVWDYHPDSARALQMGARVKQLLHNHVDIALYGASLAFARMDTVETDNEEVQRVALRFSTFWPDLDLVQTPG
jgi:hypothetical protein